MGYDIEKEKREAIEAGRRARIVFVQQKKI